MNPLLILLIATVLLTALLAAAVYRYWRAHLLHIRCVGLCHRIGDELAQQQSPELVTERVFNTVLSHTGAAVGILSYRLRGEQAFTVLRVRGLPQAVLAEGARLADGVRGWQCGGLTLSGQPEIHHAGLREAAAAHAGLHLDARQNMVCIPVASRNQTRGMLQLISAPRNAFTRAHLMELEGVGIYLDAAIHNAELIETIRRQRDSAELMYEVGLTISRALDLDEILSRAVEQAQRIMGAELIWYLDFPDARATRATIRQAAGHAPPEFHAGAGIPIVGRVAALLLEDRHEDIERRFLILDDIPTHRARDESGQIAAHAPELFCDPVVEAKFLELGMRSVLFVPVADREQRRGLLCSFATREAAYDQRDVNLLRRLANQVLIALKTADLHADHQELAVLAERERLSDELHDHMAQVINGLSLEFHALERLAGRRGDWAEVAERGIHARLDDARAAIRKAIYELRMPADRDLWQNLGEFAERYEHWHDMTVHYGLPKAALAIPLERQREVIGVVQEALWNVHKHSGVAEARVDGRYAADTGRVRIAVSDAGRGAALDLLGRGQGIATMRSRAARLGGELRVQSPDSGGFLVELEFPAHDVKPGSA